MAYMDAVRRHREYRERFFSVGAISEGRVIEPPGEALTEDSLDELSRLGDEESEARDAWIAEIRRRQQSRDSDAIEG